jgi:hypothetical protein
MNKNIPIYLFFLFFTIDVIGQDLLSTLTESQPQEKELVFQTFKGTRVVNGHSVEVKGKGELEFIIGHRFGLINSGAINLFGLDQAYIRFGLEYGITPKLGFGIGRSSYTKIFDSYLKYQMISQSRGGGSPVTITALGSLGVQTYEYTNPDAWRNMPFGDKLYYSGQLLIARKFSPNFSLQLSPIFVHANTVNPIVENKNQFAMGFSGRYKVTKSFAVNAEYFLRTDVVPNSPYSDCVSLGFDVETGGHVFQFVLSNTQGMIDRTFIGRTEGDFFGGDIHFGFNITRTFQLTKKKE